MSSTRCAVCGTPTRLVCHNCKTASYCSANCQTLDKPLHDLLCDDLVTFLATNQRPERYLALLCTNGNRRFVWVEVDRAEENNNKSYRLTPQLTQWLDGTKGPQQSVLRTMHDRTIQVWNIEDTEMFEAGFCNDPGLRDLIEGGNDFADIDDPFPLKLQGNLVIMGVGSKSEDGKCVTKYRDLTLYDFRIALDCFLDANYFYQVGEDRGDDHSTERAFPYIIFSQPKWFKGVKITNEPEVNVSGNDPYIQLMFNKDHPDIDKVDDRSIISKLLGIPLVLKRLRIVHKPVALDPSSSPPNNNPAAISLLIGINTSDDFDSWGRPAFPKYDNEYDPSFLVFREDKQDITRQQSEDGYCGREEKRAILKHWCTVAQFADYFEQLKQKKIQKGDQSWVGATVPHGMKDSDFGRKRKRGKEQTRLNAHCPSNFNTIEDMEWSEEIREALNFSGQSVELAMSPDLEDVEESTAICDDPAVETSMDDDTYDPSRLGGI